MFNDQYKFAELENDPEVVESIRELEDKLSARHGTPITLIAFEKDTGTE
ncbi:hypothetical protein [Paenibacillus protaetiae]|nr:hypothetical protein [Paenibacillus protaetiae]